MIRWNPRYLLSFILLLLAEVLIAVYVHDQFIRPYVGDILVILLIYSFLRSILPPYRHLPMCVFLFAAGVEFSQKIDLVHRLGLENNRILAIALGSTFDWADILCYAVGGLLVGIWQWRIAARR